MKTIFFIDSENVGDFWIPLLGLPTAETELVVFYTRNSPHMSYESLIRLKESDMTVTFIKCYEGTNALDFQLVSELGYRLRGNEDGDFAIVTNDTGYDAVVKYWRHRKVSIRRIPGKECRTLEKKSGRTERRSGRRPVPMQSEEMTIEVPQEQEPQEAFFAAEPQIARPEVDEEVPEIAAEPSELVQEEYMNAPEEPQAQEPRQEQAVPQSTPAPSVVSTHAGFEIRVTVHDDPLDREQRNVPTQTPEQPQAAAQETLAEDVQEPESAEVPAAEETAEAESAEAPAVEEAVASQEQSEEPESATEPQEEPDAAEQSEPEEGDFQEPDLFRYMDMVSQQIEEPESAPEEQESTPEPVSEPQESADAQRVPEQESGAEPAEEPGSREGQKKAKGQKKSPAAKGAKKKASGAKHSEEKNPSTDPEATYEELEVVLACVGGDDLGDLHNQLTNLYGSARGKEAYLKIKGGQIQPGKYNWNQREKFRHYCEVIFAHSDSKEECPSDFADFLVDAQDKRQNLNSLRSAIQKKYGKERGRELYFTVKPYVKAMNQM